MRDMTTTSWPGDGHHRTRDMPEVRGVKKEDVGTGERDKPRDLGKDKGGQGGKTGKVEAPIGTVAPTEARIWTSNLEK